jgi:hypothetical protein
MLLQRFSRAHHELDARRHDANGDVEFRIVPRGIDEHVVQRQSNAEDVLDQTDTRKGVALCPSALVDLLAVCGVQYNVDAAILARVDVRDLTARLLSNDVQLACLGNDNGRMLALEMALADLGEPLVLCLVSQLGEARDELLAHVLGGQLVQLALWRGV